MQAPKKKLIGKEKPSEAKSVVTTVGKSNQSGEKGKPVAKKNVKPAVEAKKTTANAPSKGTSTSKGTNVVQGRKKSVQVATG